MEVERNRRRPKFLPGGNVDDGCVLCRGGGKSDGYRATTRVGSAVAPRNPYADNNTNKVAPTATRALVRNPAIRARYWRSNPMTVPRPIPAPRRSSISTVLIGQPAPAAWTILTTTRTAATIR